MDVKKARQLFDETFQPSESAILTFHGVEGFDVYNCSVPFFYKGERYIFGRVERRAEWARSWVRLFKETGPDDWTLVPDSMIYTLEDPFIALIDGEMIMGGTHVRMKQSAIDTYYGYFYRGRDLSDLRYFTTGPDYMKDIRLVPLPGGKIGVFSRPRNQEILKKFGSESMIGFDVIGSIEELTADVIENAPYIEGIFQDGEWGGCNQAYLLESGKIGVIGHLSYHEGEGENLKKCYLNMSFLLDPDSHKAEGMKIIATRKSFPAGPAKTPDLTDCAFTTGIVPRSDGKVDLYSGLGDCLEGRIVIDNPFAGEGKILTTFRME